VETAIFFGAANYAGVQRAIRMAGIMLRYHTDAPSIDLDGDYPRMEAGRNRIYCRTADIGIIVRITASAGGYVWEDRTN
jgi:hypothetical protein